MLPAVISVGYARLTTATKLGRLAGGEGGAGFFALEAADGQIGRDDAVAGDLRGEGVGAKGLADGAG